MTEDTSSSTKSVALIEHLDRFPEDLRDMRRLQKRFKLTAAEAALALECWRRREETSARPAFLPH